MTLAVDFDGVLHRYSRGWHDGTIYDPPVEGAVEGLHALLDYDAVFVHTTREPEQVMPWLEALGFDVTIDDRCPCATLDGSHHGGLPSCAACQGSGLLTFWNQRGQLLVTNRKLPAVAYLDDRAVRFTDWDSAMLLLGEALGRHHRPGTEPL